MTDTTGTQAPSPATPGNLAPEEMIPCLLCGRLTFNAGPCTLCTAKNAGSELTVEELAVPVATLLGDHSRLADENAYLTWKLEKVMPLFEQARDALPAISMTTARLHRIDLQLANRMDEAGTACYADWERLGKPGCPAWATDSSLAPRPSSLSPEVQHA